MRLRSGPWGSVRAWSVPFPWAAEGGLGSGASRRSVGAPRGLSVGLRAPISAPVGLRQRRRGLLSPSRASALPPLLGTRPRCPRVTDLLCPMAACSQCCAVRIPRCVCRVSAAVPFLPSFLALQCFERAAVCAGFSCEEELWVRAHLAAAVVSPSLILLSLCCLPGDLKLFRKGGQ